MWDSKDPGEAATSRGVTNPDVSEADVDESTSKKCRKCEQVKSLDDFYVRNGKHQARCKRCLGEQAEAYRRAHPEVDRRSAQNWRDKNPDKVRARNRKWYSENKELNRIRVAEWRAANPEAWRAIQAKARDDETRRAAAREASRAWRKANPGMPVIDPEVARLKSAKRRAIKAAAQVGPVDLDALWLAQSGQCGICSSKLDRNLRWPDPASPSIDHVVPLSKGGAHSQENLQWTCLSCNVQKGARLPD